MYKVLCIKYDKLSSMNLNLVLYTVYKWRPFPFISYTSRFLTITDANNVETN